MARATRLTVDEAEKLLLHLADEHLDMQPLTPTDEFFERGMLRAIAHPALDDEQIEQAWDELLEVVGQRRDLECGLIEPPDIDEELRVGQIDAAMEALSVKVDSALAPLLRGWAAGSVCPRCLETKAHVSAMNRRPPDSLLCAECAGAYRHRGVVMPA